MLTTVRVNCSKCSKEIEVEPYLIRLREKHYCSCSCYHLARKDWKPSEAHRERISQALKRK